MKTVKYDFKGVDRLCVSLARQISNLIPRRSQYKAFAVSEGGICAGYALAGVIPVLLINKAEDADFFINDVYDIEVVGQICEEYPGIPIFSLGGEAMEADDEPFTTIFPWSKQDPNGSLQFEIKNLLTFVGEDPTRGGLLETPKRVEKAWKEWCSGYSQKPEDILKVFEDGGENYDEMITVKDIPIYSKCEHHLADIFGTCTISYIPDGKIVGLSKLSRLADMFARRLQVQERLTSQIADAIALHLKPKGVGVAIRARHMCMESRGIRQQGHHTITTALRGCIKDQPTSKAEFLRLL